MTDSTEEVKIPSPVEMEKKMIAEEGIDFFDADHFRGPSMIFYLKLEHFVKTMEELNVAELKALCKAIVMYPIEDSRAFIIEQSSDRLKKAFELGDRLGQAKLNMVLCAMYQQAQEDEKQRKLKTEGNKNGEA